SSDRKMIMWNIDNGEVLKKIKTHSKRVSALAVNDYNIVTGSRDYKIKIWGYDDSVEALDSEDETVKPKYSLIKSLKVKNGIPTALSQNENDLIVATENGYISFYNKITHDYNKQYNTLAKIQKPRKRKKKKEVLIMGEDGDFVNEDEELEEESQTMGLEPKLQKIYDVENFGNKLLCALEDSSIKVWDMEKNKAISLMRGDTTTVKDIKISSMNILTASKKGTVGVYEIETSNFVNLIEGHQYDVNSIAVYEDDKVVSAGEDYSIKIRDIESGDLILNIKEAHEDIITKIIVFENLLISASLDKTIKVRDIRDGKLISILYGHKSGVTSLAFDEDDMTLISTSEDKTLKAWSLKDFSLIATMDRHKSGVIDVIITDDYLVSIAKDKTIKVWKYYE
ncbi:MAG: WD40 repeat domain-containing protein, partial [Thiovulaceae bacterium]|nr:WD40 repeat domain-containing protein [Sulfurimonadaceae bacterium]